MKATRLHELWSSPDNTRLTPKQYSFRLPTHVAAKLAALCEMYPTKSRTQIVADLLTAALLEVENSLPKGLGDPVEPEYNDQIGEQLGQLGDELFYLGGPKGQFHDLANKHYFALEKELGNETPERLYGTVVITASEVVSASK